MNTSGRRVPSIFLFPIATVLISACAQAGDDAEAEIRAMLERKYTLQNACKPGFADDYASDDATEILPNYLGALPKDTPESIEAFIKACRAGARTRNEPSIRSVELLAENVALVIGDGTIKAVLADGSIDYEGDYTFSQVFVKTGEGWRVRHLHVSPIVPGLPTVPPRDEHSP